MLHKLLAEEEHKYAKWRAKKIRVPKKNKVASADSLFQFANFSFWPIGAVATRLIEVRSAG
jgi:hypothetical protein